MYAKDHVLSDSVLLPLFLFEVKHMESLLTALSVLIWIIVGIIALVAGTIILMIVACTIYTLYSLIKEKIKDNVQN